MKKVDHHCILKRALELPQQENSNLFVHTMNREEEDEEL